VLHVDGSGRLDDLVMWLTAVPDHDDRPRSIVYGWLSRSALRYVAVNLAAAVAWGQWTTPSLDGVLAGDPGSAEFGEALRGGRFRRTEPSGAAVGVRVLDVRRTIRPSPSLGEGTHASPATHLRRRHWQRYRVGPGDGWHYERRLIDAMIINPGQQRPQPLTVYRLPPPPR